MSFAVENPEERLEAVLPRLSLEEWVGVVDTEPSDGDQKSQPHENRETSSDGTDGNREAVQHDVIALTSSRWYQPDTDSARDVNADDETLFGPFADLVLEPGEYACVLGMDDTADYADGNVYRKKEGCVRIVDRVCDANFGREAADQCANEYGFRPYRGGKYGIQAETERRGHPLAHYHGIEELETYLSEMPEPVIAAGEPCPHCGSSDVTSSERGYGEYLDIAVQCRSCQERWSVYDATDLPPPDEACPDCGGDFRERTLQFPSIGSTAYECERCDRFTFDTLALDESDLCPDADLSDRVGPDVEAYRQKHDLDEDVATVQDVFAELSRLGVDAVEGVDPSSVPHVDSTVYGSLYYVETSSLNLDAAAIGLGLGNIEYEPDVFSGLIYHQQRDCDVYLFESGIVATWTAAERPIAESAITTTCEQLEEIGVVSLEQPPAIHEVTLV